MWLIRKQNHLNERAVYLFIEIIKSISSVSKCTLFYCVRFCSVFVLFGMSYWTSSISVSRFSKTYIVCHRNPFYGWKTDLFGDHKWCMCFQRNIKISWIRKDCIFIGFSLLRTRHLVNFSRFWLLRSCYTCKCCGRFEVVVVFAMDLHCSGIS